MALTCQRVINIAPLTSSANAALPQHARTAPPHPVSPNVSELHQLAWDHFQFCQLSLKSSNQASLLPPHSPLLSANAADKPLHLTASYFHHSFISTLDSAFIRAAFISFTQQELNGLQGATASLRAQVALMKRLKHQKSQTQSFQSFQE